MSEQQRILLVEDDHDLRHALEQELRNHGYIVMSLPDGRDALEKVGTFSPHCIVTDIIMPNSEGIELIHALNKTAPAIPVIAISGGGRVPALDVLRNAEILGVRRSLTKPFRLMELIDAVAEVLVKPDEV